MDYKPKADEHGVCYCDFDCPCYDQKNIECTHPNRSGGICTHKDVCIPWAREMAGKIKSLTDACMSAGDCLEACQMGMEVAKPFIGSVVINPPIEAVAIQLAEAIKGANQK